MKKLAKWNWLRIIRDWKTRILLVLFFVFFGSFSLLYRQQNVTFPQSEMTEEYQDERAIYRLIPKNHFEGELGQEVQQRLGGNSVALGVSRYILGQRKGNNIEGFELLPDYIESGRTVVNNNLFLYEATEFESYDLLVEEYLPPLHEVEEEARFFDALEESQLDIEWNPFSAAQMVKTSVDLLAGLILFLLIALFVADHFSKDQEENWSVTQGLPIPWKFQWRSRSRMLLGLFLVAVMLGHVVSYVVSLQTDTAGSFNYPVSIYHGGVIHYVPMWQYILIAMAMVFGLSYVLIRITTGLSWIFRNIYLTIMLVSAIYFVPQIWQIIPALSSWQPSLYLNIFGVLQGTTAANTGLNGVVWYKSFILYAVMILIIEFIFKKVFSYIPTTTAGLQRREQV